MCSFSNRGLFSGAYPFVDNVSIGCVLIALSTLVGTSVSVSAVVDKIVVDTASNSRMIILKDVYVNEVFFRDHSWIKVTKRLSWLKVGDSFDATATLIEYMDVDDFKNKKLGVKSFRNVIVQ